MGDADVLGLAMLFGQAPATLGRLNFKFGLQIRIRNLSSEVKGADWQYIVEIESVPKFALTAIIVQE